MGTCYRAGNLREVETSSGSPQHNHQHSFSSDYLGEAGASPISAHLMPASATASNFLRLCRYFPPGQISTCHCDMCYRQIHALSAISLRILQYMFAFLRAAYLFQYLPTCFDHLCRLPWSKFSALSSFVTKMFIWPAAYHRFPSNIAIAFQVTSCLRASAGALSLKRYAHERRRFSSVFD